MARTEHHDDLEEEEEEGGKKKRIDLSFSQVAGAGAATLTAATAASYLNVYGTVIGAAVMAALSTLVSPMLQHWLSRSGEQARQLAEKAVSRTGAPGPDLARTRGGSPAEEAHGSVPLRGADETRQLPEVIGDPGAEDPPSDSGGRRGWRSLAVPAAVVFILVMMVILAFELFTGRSLTSWTRGVEEPSSPTLFGGTTSAPARPGDGTEEPGTTQEEPDTSIPQPEEQVPGPGRQPVPGTGNPEGGDGTGNGDGIAPAPVDPPVEEPEIPGEQAPAPGTGEQDGEAPAPEPEPAPAPDPAVPPEG